MNNLYELEYGIKRQNEALKRVDKTAWKVAKLKAKKTTRRHIKRLEPCADC
ncbi:MAG: hypothetical protein ACO1OC_01555 [Tuberibacillus sp.]